MRIGVAPLTNETGGGAYQYGQTMLGVLAELRDAREDELVVLADGLRPDDPLLGGVDWEVAPLTPAGGSRRAVSGAKRLLRRRLSLQSRELLTRIRQHGGRAPEPSVPRRRPEVRAHLEQLGIGLVLYPFTSALSFGVGVPYVLAVHDLMHRRYPEFPEFGGEELARREYLFRNGIREATVVVVDSELGKGDVLEFYGDLIEPERVAILPFLPGTPETVTDGDRRRVRDRYRLPERFLFYPAQLWPHKNHQLIIEALAELERTAGIRAHLVLSGSKLGEVRQRAYVELVARARNLGVAERIHYLGYVPAEDVPVLYAEAVALVMPTFFGPTNIPILEAWGLECPVITSAIRGVREQADDAALLVDPGAPAELADAIGRLWKDDALRSELVRHGRERLALYTRDDYARRLDGILDQAVALAREKRNGARA